jgi:hypothetical protein
MSEISAETIREAILSENQLVRKFAIQYFSDSYSTDPSIMPIVIESARRNGVGVIIESGYDLSKLRQSADSVDWIFDMLDDPKYFEGVLTFDVQPFCLPLTRADIDLIANRKERIEACSLLPESVRRILRKRIERLSDDEQECWKRLESYCQFEVDSEAGEADDREVESSSDVIERLVRLGPANMQRTHEWISLPIDEKAPKIDFWKKIVAIDLVGEMRDVSFVPQIFRTFLEFPSDDLIRESCTQALQKIGGPTVVEAIAGNTDSLDDDTWIDSSVILGSNRSAEAAEFLRQRLEIEQDQELRNFLAIALVRQCVPDAMEIGLQVARENLKFDNRLIESIGLKLELMILADLIGERFPEYDEWAAERKISRQTHSWLTVPLPVEKRIQSAEEVMIQPTIRNPENQPRVGRNDPCPCGRGKKFKKCCMNK